MVSPGQNVGSPFGVRDQSKTNGKTSAKGNKSSNTSSNTSSSNSKKSRKKTSRDSWDSSNKKSGARAATSHKILHGLSNFSESVLSRLCCSGGQMPYDENDMDYRFIHSIDNSMVDSEQHHAYSELQRDRSWGASSSRFQHAEADLSHFPIFAGRSDEDRKSREKEQASLKMQEVQKERWLELFHRQKHLSGDKDSSSQTREQRHASGPQTTILQHDLQPQPNYPMLKPSSRLVPQMIPTSSTEASTEVSTDASSCEGSARHNPVCASPHKRLQLESTPPTTHMDRKGPSMTIPHRIVSMSSLPPPPPPPPPAMPVLPMATSLPPPPLPAAATSNRTSASTSAAEEQDYEYVQPMQVASPSSPPRSISQSNPPASSVANSTLTSSSMVSFDDLFSVDTSSECSTAITSHQFSVKSQLSSPKRIVTVSPTPSMHQVNRCPARHQASPMQQGYADSPTHAPMVGNNLVTPDYDRANHQQQRHHQQDWQAWPTPNKASRPNNFHNLTQYWKEQERLRLQRQQERLQARQLSHVVVHSSDNPAPVSPRQQIRHTNHADGLTC